jgi:hypothetical protein
MNELTSRTNELSKQFGQALNELNSRAPIKFCRVSQVCIT